MKPKLSILIYSLIGGGAERVVSILLHELTEDYDITLVMMRDEILFKIPEETKIHFIEHSDPSENGIIKLLKLPFLGWKYKLFCKKNNIDISLAFLNRPSYVSIFAKIFGSPSYTVISERTTPSMMYSGGGVLSKVSRLLIRYLYPKADFIVANSDGNRLDLIDNFSISPKILQTLYNPFDVKKIEKLAHDEVDNYEFKKFTFVSVGRLDSGKNHQLLIDAFSELDTNQAELIILGQGELRTQLEKQIKALNLEQSVTLLGFDNNPYKYFSQADAFVFASNYEGFPNVLVEALICNLPVISTDCKSGPREILAPNSKHAFPNENDLEIAEYGLLVPTKSKKGLTKAMKLLIEDGRLLKSYKEKTALLTKRFSKEVIVKEFVDVLNKGSK